MSQYQKGTDALAGLGSDGGSQKVKDNEFAKLGIGKSYKVRVLGVADVMKYFGYGMHKKVNTFVADKPSTRNKKGFVDSDRTPWDLAEKYYRDKQFAAKDAGKEDESKEHSKQAYLYQGKPRFVFGFIDLDSGKPIVIDFTKNQAELIYPTIKKYEKKYAVEDGKELAFELSKTNSTGQAKDTKVSLTPLIDFEDDLTEDEQKNFHAYDGKEFDSSLFDELLYEMDEEEQIKMLGVAGFDVSLIGLSAGKSEGTEEATPIANTTDTYGEPVDVTEEDLPF